MKTPMMDFNAPFGTTYLPVENRNTADARFNSTFKKSNNMNPKEKAHELVDKMYEFAIFDEGAKHCALIAVNEILAIFYDDIQSMWVDELKYWQEVKQEIEKL